MTKSFHISKKGNPEVCKATISCPLQPSDEHFPTREAAQKFYETKMSSHNFNKSPQKPFKMKVSENTLQIVKKLEDAGITSFIVGGSVRDTMLGKDNKDIDVEMYGRSKDGGTLEFSDIKRVFDGDKNIKMDEAGASFSVLKIYSKGEDFDLALPRTEQSTGDKHTDYEVQHDSTMSFEEAASRRDFTINSMGYSPLTGELKDPYNGTEDLRNKLLKHVGPAFSDDALRPLRAVNFASRFNFDVAPETVDLCKEIAPQYKNLARERVEEEFNKLFYKGEHCDKGLTVLHDIGWSEEIPEFKGCSREKLEEYGKKLNETPKGLRKAALSSMMTDDSRKDPIKLFESSSNGRTLSHSFKKLTEAKTRGEIVSGHRSLKAKNNISNADLRKTFEVLGKNSKIFDDLPETPEPTAVTGKFLLEKGFEPGPNMGKLIQRGQLLQDNTGELDPEVIFAELNKG